MAIWLKCEEKDLRDGVRIDPLFRINKEILFHPIHILHLYKIESLIFSFQKSNLEGALAVIRFCIGGECDLDETASPYF